VDFVLISITAPAKAGTLNALSGCNFLTHKPLTQRYSPLCLFAPIGALIRANPFNPSNPCSASPLQFAIPFLYRATSSSALPSSQPRYFRATAAAASSSPTPAELPSPAMVRLSNTSPSVTAISD
jgi:hypothetical protein